MSETVRIICGNAKCNATIELEVFFPNGTSSIVGPKGWAVTLYQAGGRPVMNVGCPLHPNPYNVTDACTVNTAEESEASEMTAPNLSVYGHRPRRMSARGKRNNARGIRKARKSRTVLLRNTLHCHDCEHAHAEIDGIIGRCLDSDCSCAVGTTIFPVGDA